MVKIRWLYFYIQTGFTTTSQYDGDDAHKFVELVMLISFMFVLLVNMGWWFKGKFTFCNAKVKLWESGYVMCIAPPFSVIIYSMPNLSFNHICLPVFLLHSFPLRLVQCKQMLLNWELFSFALVSIRNRYGRRSQRLISVTD